MWGDGQHVQDGVSKYFPLLRSISVSTIHLYIRNLMRWNELRAPFLAKVSSFLSKIRLFICFTAFFCFFLRNNLVVSGGVPIFALAPMKKVEKFLSVLTSWNKGRWGLLNLRLWIFVRKKLVKDLVVIEKLPTFALANRNYGTRRLPDEAKWSLKEIP